MTDLFADCARSQWLNMFDPNTKDPQYETEKDVPTVNINGAPSWLSSPAMRSVRVSE